MVQQKPAGSLPAQTAGVKAKVVFRRTPGKEQGYIMIGGVYCIGRSMGQDAQYENKLRSLLAKLKDGSVVPTKDACAALLALPA